MPSQHRLWLVFGAGALSVGAALAWMTHHTLQLERAEVDAQRQAKFQESVRLALWRMDSMMTPLIAREAARPYFHYQPFYPAGRPYADMLGPPRPDDVLVPSPLLRLDNPLVKINYQLDVSGALSSPQVPGDALKRFAESGYTSAYSIAAAGQRLATLNAIIARPRLAIAREPAPTTQAATAADPQLQAQPEKEASETSKPASPLAGAPAQQVQQSASEYNVRKLATQSAQKTLEPIAADAEKQNENRSQRLNTEPTPPASPAALSDASPNPSAPARDAAKLESPASVDDRRVDLDSPPVEPSDQAPRASPTPNVGAAEPGVSQTAFTPQWLARGPEREPELVFEREVEAGGFPLRQGFWLDWPALRASLLSSAKDLFPDATLVPMLGGVDGAPPEELGRALAGSPAKFEVGAYALTPGPAWTPTRTALVITWLAAAGATIAIGLVLRESNDLAERRGRFVTAVTHELRTPLTTFVMYSQMLAGGMVRDEETRTTYVRTLLRESQRLAGIVESVLEYARLGRRRGHTPRRTTTAAALVELMTPSLASRCQQSDMALVIETHGELGFEVHTDPPTLERIVFNLVDNACKYSGQASDRRIHLLAKCEGRDLELVVRDHGPGVPLADRHALFRPFVRGKAHADGSVPGLGLGLALAQSLALELGGTLRLSERSPDGGAEFVIRLPGGKPPG